MNEFNPYGDNAPPQNLNSAQQELYGNMQNYNQSQFNQNQQVQQTYYGNSPNVPQQNMNNGSPKKSKAGLIIGIIVIAIALIIAAIAVIIIKAQKLNNGFSARDDAIISMFTAINSKDSDGIYKCFPDKKLLTSESEAQIDELIDMFTSDELDFTVDYENRTIQSEANLSSSDIKTAYSLRADSGYEVTYTVPFTQIVDGSTYTGTEDFSIVLAYTQKKWVILAFSADQDSVVINDYVTVDDNNNLDELNDSEEVIPEYATEASEDITNSEELGGSENAIESEEENTSVTNTANVDITSGEISINSKSYVIPFKYSEIKDEYSFNVTDYSNGDTEYDENYVLNQGNEIYGITLDSVKNPDSYLYLSVHLCNPTSEILTIYDAYINNISCYTDSRYPDDPVIVVPGGGTWNMTQEEVVAIYGTPEDDNLYVSEDEDYASYTYEQIDESNRYWTLRFIFSGNKVTDIDYYYY
jgi:flagellar basal body-associated protein FliL